MSAFPELFALDALRHLADEYGYWAVFGGIALENAGVPLPGETIVLIGGYLAGNGDLSYPWVLGSAIAGAVLGDSCGYWLGRWGGWPLLVRLGQLFRLGDDKLEMARTKFNNNARQAVFWGRFVALLRIFAGPMAGMAGMPYHQFLIYNVAGATLWATTIVSVAFGVGRSLSLEALMAWISHFALGAGLIVVLWFVVPILWERRKIHAVVVDPGHATSLDPSLDTVDPPLEATDH